MSYQVLARKYRPRFFREMVGQEHVLRALINALDTDRLHHAYLFSGTRGVGKTSLARILAKCLSCDVKVSSEPCGQCNACLEIAEGRFVDLIEVDAASRTRVEDTRELLDNVQYAPTKGRFKIYLIDEVHMLSTHSFNALLKTLEEPPAHVKFLLATTDPQKLPPTVLSRCLQFNLKNLTAKFIVGHLQDLLQKEQVSFEDEALWSLANAAKGSMRDALSLTDQAIAFCLGEVAHEPVSQMLGSIDRQHIHQLTEALIDHNAADLLASVSELSEFSPDYSAVLNDLLLYLHRLTIAQAVPSAVDDHQGDKNTVIEQAQRITAEELQLFYQMALLGKKDFPLAPDPRAGLEMALLRMLAFRPQGSKEPLSVAAPQSEKSPPAEKKTLQIADNVSQEVDLSREAVNAPPLHSSIEMPSIEARVVTETESAVSNSLPSEVHKTASDKSLREDHSVKFAVVNAAGPAEVAGRVAPEVTHRSSATGSQCESNTDWLTIFDQLPFSGLLGSVASQAVVDRIEGDQWFMKLDQSRAQLFNASHADQMATIMSEYFGRPILVNITLQVHHLLTPQQYRKQQEQAKKAHALQVLEADAGYQSIITDYAAEIDMASVVYVPTGKDLNRGEQS